MRVRYYVVVEVRYELFGRRKKQAPAPSQSRMPLNEAAAQIGDCGR